jgi:hypothetical protein
VPSFARLSIPARLFNSRELTDFLDWWETNAPLQEGLSPSGSELEITKNPLTDYALLEIVDVEPEWRPTITARLEPLVRLLMEDRRRA